MATTYPITIEELRNIPGVGEGKAKRYGQEFVDLIRRHVEENEIERPEDMRVRTVANKSKLKVEIITAIDRKVPLDALAESKDLEMDELLDGKEWGDDYNNVRARTIILLLYETGLRRSELTGLDNKDVDFTLRQVRVTGKGRKQRIVPFGDELEKALRQYIEVRDKTIGRKCDALFLTEKGQRISGEKVYSIVRENLTFATSLKKRSPHVLRHSFATALLNHDAGLENVRLLLGHESIETTEIYTHATFEQMKRVYKDAHPRG
jgi:integrase/recombinase XerC